MPPPLGKYHPDVLLQMFKRAAVFRNEMKAAGFTDNGGAIHSAERILDILGLRLNYSGLNHRNNLKKFQTAIFSCAAKAAHQAGEPVQIEHVSPLREFTRRGIEILDKDGEEALQTYVRENYKLVLLTPDEARSLNRKNRSKMTSRRLEDAGIAMCSAPQSN